MMLLGAMLSIKMPEISGIRSFGTMGVINPKMPPSSKKGAALDNKSKNFFFTEGLPCFRCG